MSRLKGFAIWRTIKRAEEHIPLDALERVPNTAKLGHMSSEMNQTRVNQKGKKTMRPNHQCCDPPDLEGHLTQQKSTARNSCVHLTQSGLKVTFCVDYYKRGGIWDRANICIQTSFHLLTEQIALPQSPTIGRASVAVLCWSDTQTNREMF